MLCDLDTHSRHGSFAPILTAGRCILGTIFGTGMNGAYLEQVANITKLGNGALPPSDS
jgi:hexokinase